MTERDKQLREAMDLLQDVRTVLASALPCLQWPVPSLGKRLNSLHKKTVAFQKRWSKSQKQPQ